MRIKRMFAVLLSSIFLIGCFDSNVAASENQHYQVLRLEDTEHKTLDLPNESAEHNSVAPTALGVVSKTIPANSVGYATERIYLEATDIVFINCSYSPPSANVNFGLIAPNGLFYYVNSANGSINQTIQISERGYYTVGIENTSSYAVSVTGYVNY